MKKFSPNWVWFVGVFLIALLVSGWKVFLADKNMVVVALLSLLNFPIGLVSAFGCHASAVSQTYIRVVVGVGFLIYAILLVFGSLLRSWLLWVVLALLLLVNIVGCHRLWNHAHPFS
jgi:hypothetical protein